ncbi:MAG: N-acetylmuramoyl-L-alanine amidase [candidate division Zixibacteria bacterium]
MWLKNTFRNNLLRALTAAFFWLGLAAGIRSEIVIVYPHDGQRVGAVDSTFIFGHLKKIDGYNFDDLTVRINNKHDIPVHRDGGFLAFVPIAPDSFQFTIEAYPTKALRTSVSSSDRLDSNSITVYVPAPIRQIAVDALAIGGDYRPPSGELILSEGELLEVSFVGTPGMAAWFSLPGLIDSIPMSESSPRTQAYWGESLFGAGAVPDSLMIHGIYTGSYRIQDRDSLEAGHVNYHLALSESVRDLMRRFWRIEKDSHADLLLAGPHSPVERQSRYSISLNTSDFPRTVRFSDSVQIIRHGPRKGYFSTFQPEGVLARAVGAEGSWLKLRLTDSQIAWANRESVEFLPQGQLPPHSYVRVVRTYGIPDHVLIECPLSGVHPYQVVEVSSRSIRLRLFGVTSDTDWIRYDANDSLVKIIRWSQPEPKMYELTIELNQDLWGYEAFYEGTTFKLRLNKPPENLWTLRGKRIVIDPGHSSDPGAIGATGLTEAEANLGIALETAKLLKRRGAEVILTRSDDSHVALYDRPAMAVGLDADLFVSIHNNALPDGVNPFVNNGVSCYYYHPHSMQLGREIHKQMIKQTKLPDHGFYHGNLAVARPTQYPAVLVECAFMMLPEQEAMLKTKRYRFKVARAIAFGIESFLKGYDSE